MPIADVLPIGLVSCALFIAAKEAWELSADSPGALDVRSLSGIATLLLAAVLARFMFPRRASKCGKPVLAVDLDECCCGYVAQYCKFSNAKHGTQLCVEDFHSYKFWKVSQARLPTREAAVERVYEFHASKQFASLEPMHGARIALDVLKERFELHVVTSRQTDIEAQTREWVATHFPAVFTALHFGNHFGKPDARGKVPSVSKPEMCARIGAVALLDDSLDYARQCASAGIPVFLFGDYPWNQLKAGEPPLDAMVTRVPNWRMACQLITPAVVEGMC